MNTEERSNLQLAKEYVESTKLAGTSLTFKPLSWAAPPYELSKDSPLNSAGAKVSLCCLILPTAPCLKVATVF